MLGEPEFEARTHRFKRGAGQLLVGEHMNARRQHVIARGDLGHDLAQPTDRAVARQHEGLVDGLGHAGREIFDLAGERLLRRGVQGARDIAARRRVERETEALQGAQMLAFDHDVAGAGDFRFKHCVLSQATHEHAGAPIDETMGEPLVQGVGQVVLYLTRDALPMLGIIKPVRPVGDVIEGSALGYARRQGVDLAIDPVQRGQLPREPVVGNLAGPDHETIERLHEIGMRGGRKLAIIRHLADIPEALDVGAGLALAAHVGVVGHDVEHQHVLGEGRARQPLAGGLPIQRGLQGVDRTEIQIGVAPLQHRYGIKTMVFEGVDEILVEGRATASGAERAILDMPSRATGDLAELRGFQPAVMPAVELAVAGEGDVVDIEIEPHADGVGRDDIIHLAGLVERHLRVAGARAQRAKHHRRAAPLAADEFGDGVNLLRREGDNGAAGRQAGNLAFAGEGQGRQARAGDDRRAGQKALDDLAHGRGADDPGFLAPATVQQAIREDMATVEIGGELRLVDGDEFDVEVARHRFDRRHPVAGVPRLDLFLASDQGDLVNAGLLDHAAIDLARQQAQRQADRASAILQHPLDGEMGFARVRGPKHRGDGPGGRAPTGAPVMAVHRQCQGFRSRSARRKRLSCTTLKRRRKHSFTHRTGWERIAPESSTIPES